MARAKPPTETDPPEAVVAAGPGVTYRLDGKGGIALADAAAPVPSGRGFKLVLLPTDVTESAEWLADQFGRVTAEALLERDPRPHCTIQDEGALLALNAVPVLDRLEIANQRHVVFWVEHSRVIAVTDLDVEALIGVAPGRGASSAPTTPIHLVTRVALRAADRVEPLLDALSEKTDDLEEEVLRSPTDRTRVRLNAIRRAAIMLRRTILPQRDALTTIETSAFTWFSQRDRARLREAVGWSARLAAEIGSFAERAALIQDQITDRRAEQLNRSLLILAAVTTIFMPLTLITGLLGMNVAGIPFADQPWAFLTIVGILLAIAVLEFLWFRSRKWL